MGAFGKKRERQPPRLQAAVIPTASPCRPASRRRARRPGVATVNGASASGAKLAVTSVTPGGHAETVYNFQVRDLHTYFVGDSAETAVLVHNDDCAPPAGKAGTSSGTQSGSSVSQRGHSIFDAFAYFSTAVNGVFSYSAQPRLTPEYFGVKSITEDARLHRMWEDSIKSLYYSQHGKTGNDLRKYLGLLETPDGPDGQQARYAFRSVRSKFVNGYVKPALAAGERFPGYSFDEIHHWNYFLRDNVDGALDPRQLFPTDKANHDLIGLLTRGGANKYTDSIRNDLRANLDLTYPFAPRASTQITAEEVRPFLPNFRPTIRPSSALAEGGDVAAWANLGLAIFTVAVNIGWQYADQKWLQEHVYIPLQQAAANQRLARANATWDQLILQKRYAPVAGWSASEKDLRMYKAQLDIARKELKDLERSMMALMPEDDRAVFGRRKAGVLVHRTFTTEDEGKRMARNSGVFMRK